MKARQTSKGQSVLEFMMSMGVVFFISFFALNFIFAAASKMYIHHYLNESLLCMAKGNRALKCKKEMKKNIRRFVVWGKLTNIQLIQGRRKWTGSLVWKLHSWAVPFKRTLALPKDLL